VKSYCRSTHFNSSCYY